jgi:hypothetical protein
MILFTGAIGNSAINIIISYNFIIIIISVALYIVYIKKGLNSLFIKIFVVQLLLILEMYGNIMLSLKIESTIKYVKIFFREYVFTKNYIIKQI